jgi:uncharacterized protein YfaQ (DUF2300 family)
VATAVLGVGDDGVAELQAVSATNAAKESVASALGRDGETEWVERLIGRPGRTEWRVGADRKYGERTGGWRFVPAG